MPPEELYPAIPASERRQTQALESAGTGIGKMDRLLTVNGQIANCKYGIQFNLPLKATKICI